MSVLNGARVLSLSFHSGTTNQPDLSASTLKREVEKFWIQTHIPFDHEKSLVHLLQFLQNKCDAVVGVAGYFLIKDLFLSSDLTNQKLITQKFEHTLQGTCHGGSGSSQERVFDQVVKVLNPSLGRIHRDLRVKLDRFLKLEESYNQEPIASNYQTTKSLVQIFEQIEQVRKDLHALNQLRFQRDMYRREIRQLKYSDF